MKFQAFNSSCFWCKSYFQDDGRHSYLVFQLVYSCLKKIVNSNHISLGKKRRLSDESVKPPVESNNRLTPVLKSINTKSRVKINGGSLKQQSVTKYYGNFKKCV